MTHQHQRVTAKWAGTAVLIGLLGIAAWMLRRPDAVGTGELGPEQGQAMATDGGSSAELVAVPARSLRSDLMEPRREAASAPGAPQATATGDRLLTGRVINPDGAPVPGALVSIFEVEDGAPVSSGDCELAKADGQGKFSLHVPDWAWENHVLLTARGAGYRPYSKTERLEAAFLLKPHVLDLSDGFEISGRVIYGGQPVANTALSLDVAYGVGGIFGPGPQAWWAQDRLEEKEVGGQTDENGTFRITGLADVEYDLHISVEGDWTDRLEWGRMKAKAPSHRVYDMTGAKLSVVVMGPLGPLEGAQLVLSRGHRTAKRKTTLDPAEFDVPPHSEIQLAVSHPTIETLTQTIETLGPSQWQELAVPVDLISRPTLTVTLPGAFGAGIQELNLRLEPDVDSRAVDLVAVRTAAVDQFTVAPVPAGPGPVYVTLEPSQQRGPGHFLDPQTKRLDLPPSGNVATSFSINEGGRCDINVWSSKSGGWSAQYSLTDGSGTVWLTRWLDRSSGDGYSALGDAEFSVYEEQYEVSEGPPTGDTAGLPERLSSIEDSAVRRSGLLPPGDYTLNVTSSDHKPVTRKVTIKSGVTTTEHVALEQSAKAR